jgi:hypothetical protein
MGAYGAESLLGRAVNHNMRIFGWKRRAAVPIAVMAVALVAGLMNVPTAKAAPRYEGAGRITASAAAKSEAAASSAPCTFGGPSGATTCTSTDPTVTKVAYSGSGDCSTTYFNWQIYWGDNPSPQTLSGYGSAPYESEPIATHTYRQPGTYGIRVTGQPANGGSCTWNPTSYTFTLVQSTSPSPSCDSSYQTVVTDNAGYAAAALPELFTDKVTVTWCTGGNGYVRIVSSSQHPSVEPSGFSVSGAAIKALKLAGIGFGVTPATAPMPAIGNATGYATATASGLSFTGDFNLGADLVTFVSTELGGAIVKGLVTELVPLIRAGDLGRASRVLLRGWNALASAFSSWASRDFGLPASWAASVLENLPLDKIVDEVVHLTGTFVSVATQTLTAMNSNVTAQDVIDAVKHAIQRMADALDYPWTAWAPRITVTVRQVATVDVSGRKGPGITVEEPSKTTTP